MTPTAGRVVNGFNARCASDGHTLGALKVTTPMYVPFATPTATRLSSSGACSTCHVHYRRCRSDDVAYISYLSCF